MDKLITSCRAAIGPARRGLSKETVRQRFRFGQGAAVFELLTLLAATLSGLITTTGLHASGTITNADQAAVRAAMATGGTVTLAFNGSVVFDEPLLVRKDTAVDATGYSVAFDGGQRTRHFITTNGASLRLVNLTLTNGRYWAADGATNRPGNPAKGGSILNAGGRLEIENCKFLNNQALAGNGGPAFNFSPGISATDGGPGLGGAIFSKGGEVIVRSSLFGRNVCAGGKGVREVTYTGGGGNALGGAIFTTNSCSLTLIEVTFTNNLAKAGEVSRGRPFHAGGVGFGGAVSVIGAALAITNCVFSENQVEGATHFGGFQAPKSGEAHGGAIYKEGGKIWIERSWFAGNSVTGGGGIQLNDNGIVSAYAYGGALEVIEASEFEVRNSAFTFNHANGGAAERRIFTPPGIGGGAYGGAIYSFAVMLQVVNSTFFGNQANGGFKEVEDDQSYGGRAEGGAVSGGGLFLNVTFSGNSARWGDGTTGWGSSLAGGGILLNTILSCPPGETNVFGTITDEGHNLCSDDSAQFTLSSSRSRLDPFLGNLGNHGGPTPTLPLLPQSPAIDAGDDDACPPTDQRGLKRPIGTACDIGAFELAPILTLVSRQDQGMTVFCEFQAGRTNQLMASTNLIDWTLLGIGLSGTNGVFGFEDRSALQTPWKFYRVGVR